MAAKAILTDLLLYAGTNGQAFPSEEKIASDMGINPRYVRKILKELKVLGIINWKRRFSSTNKYTFHPDLYHTSEVNQKQSKRNSSSSPTGTKIPDPSGSIVPDSRGTIIPPKKSQIESSQIERKSLNKVKKNIYSAYLMNGHTPLLN